VTIPYAKIASSSPATLQCEIDTAFLNAFFSFKKCKCKTTAKNLSKIKPKVAMFSAFVTCYNMSLLRFAVRLIYNAIFLTLFGRAVAYKEMNSTTLAYIKN
jgi:hypothetical protein